MRPLTGGQYTLAVLPTADPTFALPPHESSSWPLPGHTLQLSLPTRCAGWTYMQTLHTSPAAAAMITVTVLKPLLALLLCWCCCRDHALQDGHRQRTVNWVDSTGGTNAAFDFTTKGILQEALGRSELWRLVDAQVRECMNMQAGVRRTAGVLCPGVQ